MKRVLARLAIALALVAGGMPAGTSVLRVRAANPCPAFQVQGSGIGLDPRESVNDFTATGSPDYNWAGVCGFSIAVGVAAPDGGPEVAYTINLDAPLPAFPTGNGDTGVTISACADVNGPVGGGPVQVGVGLRGEPVYDGPYPAEDGYKYCTWASNQAGTPFDYGVAIYDPANGFRSYDYPSLQSAAGMSTISAPSNLLGPGTTSVTLYLPRTFTFRPTIGVSHSYSEQMTGAPSNDFVFTAIAPQPTLPFPVCVNQTPLGIACNGNQLFGPVFGIGGSSPSGISGWAPGFVICGTPITCATGGTGGFQNAVDLGVDPAERGKPTPCADAMDIPIAPDCAVIVGPNTAYISLYGRIWPGEPEVPRVPAPGGGQFTPGPAFLPTGA